MFRITGQHREDRDVLACRNLKVLLTFSGKNIGASWMLILRVNKMNTCTAFIAGILTTHSSNHYNYTPSHVTRFSPVWLEVDNDLVLIFYFMKFVIANVFIRI